MKKFDNTVLDRNMYWEREREYKNSSLFCEWFWFGCHATI